MTNPSKAAGINSGRAGSSTQGTVNMQTAHTFIDGHSTPGNVNNSVIGGVGDRMSQLAGSSGNEPVMRMSFQEGFNTSYYQNSANK